MVSATLKFAFLLIVAVRSEDVKKPLDDANEMIDKISEESGENALKVWSAAADGAATLMGQLMVGGTPSPQDIAKSIFKVLTVVAGIVDPILGVVTSFVLSFLGAIFPGSGSSSTLALMLQLQTVIDMKVLAAKVERLENWLYGSVRAMRETSSVFHSDDHKDIRQNSLRGQNEDNDRHERDFFPCLDSYSSSKCDEWEKAGTVSMQLFFAHFRFQTYISEAWAYAGDTAVVTGLVKAVKDSGTKLMPQIRHALDTFKKSRPAAVKDPNVPNPAGDPTVGRRCYELPGIFSKTRCDVDTNTVVDTFNNYKYLQHCNCPKMLSDGRCQWDSDQYSPNWAHDCYEKYLQTFNLGFANMETQYGALVTLTSQAGLLLEKANMTNELIV
jgi:hypothetical protein